MSKIRARAERTEAIIARYRQLQIPLAQLHRSIDAADTAGRGVAYLTLRRILEGAIPTDRTLDKIEAGLREEELSRDGSGNAAVA